MAKKLDPTAILADVLTEHGPMSKADIAQRLRQAGVPGLDAVMARLLDEISCPAIELLDERWAWLPALLAGRVFTHRLDADELAHDVLRVTPDLDPITELCHHDSYQRLVDGSAVHVVLADFDDELIEEAGVPIEVIDAGGALLLERGTLGRSGVLAGDLIGLRLTGQGLALEPVAAPGSGAAAGAALAALLDADKPAAFIAAAWTACAANPGLFSEPLPPLGEITDACGLARQGEWLAPGGFDWGRWDFQRACRRLETLHDLDSDDALTLHALITLHGQLDRMLAAPDDLDAPDPPDTPNASDTPTVLADSYLEAMSEAAATLVDPRLAMLFIDETLGPDGAGADALGLLAEMLEPRVPRRARVAYRWLRAVALERLGDIAGAERELLAAEAMDVDWPLPLLDLARFASDRGDAEGGLALLHRAGAEPDHPLVELLQQYRTAPRSDLGRNAPCWCGSGRKYKKCHLGHEQLPLTERARWLYAKAVAHTLAGDWFDTLLDLARERSRYADADEPVDDVLAEALADPLVIDATLFEGGAFEEFLALRGPLLPDDERLLAEQWQLAERSVFEVEQVRPGRGLTLRDVRTGDIHEVVERTASRQLKHRQLICARVVPAGDCLQIFGGLEPVALRERDPLIELLDDEPDPVSLVAQLTRPFAPPTLVNTEGEPITLCEAGVRFDDPAAITSALDDTYDRVDGEAPPRWTEYATTEGMQRVVRATLALDGDTLRVEANSEPRFDRVLATLARLDPAMEVLEEARQPLPDAREAAKVAKQVPNPGGNMLDPADPEVAALLSGFIRDYEAKWLDEPIPALSGYTPRQAADDPTRRGDLIKLLDSFPAGAAARGGMDADRLRAALGLD